MIEGIDTRVTPSLHPINVTKVEGYDDDTRPYLGQAESAFSEAYQGLQSVHDARAAAAQNPTWNEAQQVIATDDFGQRVFARIARQMDAAKANLDKSISALEEQLSAPVTSKAAHSVSAEIRAYVKSLSTGERMTFLQGAIANGDEVSASAVLGGPPYLSGIDATTQTVLTRQYHERVSPQVAKRVMAMRGARDLITDRGGLVFKELEKAVGKPPQKVRALREAKNAAEQAFVLRGA